MNPIDIAPPQATPVKAVGRSRKGEDATEDNGDGGFAGTMKQVANGKKQPSASSRQQGQAQEAANVRVRMPVAERLERHQRTRADGETGIDTETKTDGNDIPDGKDAEDEGQASTLNATGGLRSAHDVLAMMMARGGDRTHAPTKQGSDEQSSVRSVDAGEEQSAPTAKDTAAALDKLNVLSIKSETHLARANAQPVSEDVAQKLAQIGNGHAPGNGKAGEPTLATKGATPNAPTANAKAGDAGPTDAVPHATGQQVPAVDPGQQNGFANDAGGERGVKNDAKLALREPGAAEPVKQIADKAPPPVATGSPMEQLAPRLLDTAHEMKAAASAAPTASTSTASSPSAGPMRVLSIDLHPAELGSVTVRMSLAGETLGVQIEAERPETARLLQHDASALSDMLRTAGVQVDGVTVRAANMDSVSSGTGASQSFMQDNSQSQPGGAQADARASGGNGREQNRQPFGESRQDQGQNGQQRSSSSAGSGLYV